MTARVFNGLLIALLAVFVSGCASLPDWRLPELHMPDLSLRDLSMPDWRPWRNAGARRAASGSTPHSSGAGRPCIEGALVYDDEPAPAPTPAADNAPAHVAPSRPNSTRPMAPPPSVPASVESERAPLPYAELQQSGRAEAEALLNRAIDAYKRFDYEAAVHWAERVLARTGTTPQQRFEARIWAGAAAYLLGDESTARQYFHLAHRYAPNAAFPRASFPARLEDLYDEVCQQGRH